MLILKPPCWEPPGYTKKVSLYFFPLFTVCTILILMHMFDITEEIYLIWQNEWDMIFSSLEYVTGGSRSLSLIIKCDAIVSSVFMPHSLHIQPPALSVELIDFGTFHLTLNTGGHQPLHLLLHHTYTPVSDGKIQRRVHQRQMRFQWILSFCAKVTYRGLFKSLTLRLIKLD